jgi:hypothetical protein
LFEEPHVQAEGDKNARSIYTIVIIFWIKRAPENRPLALKQGAVAWDGMTGGDRDAVKG